VGRGGEQLSTFNLGVVATELMSVAIILASCKETETIVTVYNGIGMRDTEEITSSWQRVVAPVVNREFTEQQIARGSTEIANGSTQCSVWKKLNTQ